MSEEDKAGAAPAVTPEEPKAEKSYTKAELDAIVDAAIKDRFKKVPSKEEIESLRAKAKKADELEDAQRSETEKAVHAAEVAERGRIEAEAELERVKLSNLRMKVGAAKGLHPDLSERLLGSTEEEIAADADKLLKITPAPDVGAPANPGAPPSPASLEVQIREAYRKGDAKLAIALENQKHQAAGHIRP